MTVRAAALSGAAALAAVPALAEDFNPLGDGSGFNNADLVRDPTTGCENCQPNPPHEWDAPFFDLDWSLALRGAYVQSGGTGYFEASAVPSVTLSHETLRGGYDFAASAEITRSTIEDFRLAAARGGLSARYQLDELTAVSGSVALSMSRASATAPGVAGNIGIQPLVLEAGADAEVSRDFGPFVVTATADASRTSYGETTLTNGTLVDNTSQSNWSAGAVLRVGYRVTPILTAFVEGGAGYQWYDAPSPTYLVALNAADYELRTGLSGTWNEILEAEASIGIGHRRFAEAALGGVTSALYDASVTFRPDETLEMRGAFTTEFDAPGAGSGGTARLQYAATADVSYRVNPWLRWRASAGWQQAQLIGTATVEHGYDAGIGADYLLNEHTTLTADYAYSYRETTPAPGDDSHRVTLGVTFSR